MGRSIRALCAGLVIALAASLWAPAQAQTTAAPAAPEWVKAEEYIIFPGDPVYSAGSWDAVLARREAARQKGALLPYEDRGWVDGSPGVCYETALTRMRLAYNYTGYDLEARTAYQAAGDAFHAAQTGWGDLVPQRDKAWYRLGIEKYRCYLRCSVDYVPDWGRVLVPALDALDMTLTDFFDAIRMERVPQAERDIVAAQVEAYWPVYYEQRSHVSVLLDGKYLFMDTPTQVSRQRIMAPVRALAEALGAQVTWVPQAHQVILERAGSTVVMTLGSAIAQVDGEAVLMDVAPYADQNRTYFPVRYAAEFFGQRVNWNDTLRQVEITEDKQGADESWALGLGALLSAAEGGDPAVFGGGPRAPRSQDALSPAAASRAMLREEWELPDRAALLAALEGEGQSPAFLEAAAEVKDLTAAEIDSRSASLSEVDRYMWPRTRMLWKKWGQRGITAWDLCAKAALIQWGYTAGYLTYTEALERTAPLAQKARESFTSWDELYENFLDGYYWCAREALESGDVMETPLGRSYLYLRHSPGTRTLFNSNMFTDKD